MKQGRLVWAVAAATALCVGLVGCGSRADSPNDAATLEVACFPAADVWIDGTWKGSTPISISVPPGTHQVALKQNGFGEHEETIDLAAGGRSTVEAVLIAQDPDDRQVIAQLARPFDVTVEPFEAPERHRGGRKALPAVLLWPQSDVRPEGLSTFGLEVSEDYEGDGFLVFRKGRNVLYKERFDPDTLTTVATIPLDVLEDVDVGDTVTWGIAFDSRRKKDIESRFKIVNRPKADKRLDRIARDKHMARQPPVVKAMVAANALENYRLYTEALVACLEILQDHPTSTQPYQGIVTCLRRLDAKESRLWGLASQHVSGKGRARAGQTGITAFAPQRAKSAPVAPIAPSVVAARPSAGARPPRTGDGITPGLRPAPEQGTTTEPSTAEPSPPPTVTPTTPPTPGFDPAALGARARETAEAASQARTRADTAQQEADQAAAAAQQAQTRALAARETAAESSRAADEAQQAYDADPSPENEEAANRARDASREAEDTAHRAAEEARASQGQAQAAQGKAQQAGRRAEGLEAEAQDAQRQADDARAEIPTPEPQTPRAEHARDQAAFLRVQEAYRASNRDVEAARSEVERLAAAAEYDPGDERVQQDLAAARTELERVEQNAARLREEYVEALGDQPAAGQPAIGQPAPGSPAVDDGNAPKGRQPNAQTLFLQESIRTADAAFVDAERQMNELGRSLEESPDDADLQRDYDAAVEAREKALAALKSAIAAYEAAVE